MSTLHVFLLEGVPQDRVGPGDSIVVYSTVVSTEMSYTRMPSSYQVRSVPPPSTLCIYGGGGGGKSIVHMASPCAIDLQYSFAHITYFSNTMGSKKINKKSVCSFANALQVACSQYVYNFANMFLNIEHIFAICLPSCKHVANIKGPMCNTFAI
jgi:hypothetical protein